MSEILTTIDVNDYGLQSMRTSGDGKGDSKKNSWNLDECELCEYYGLRSDGTMETSTTKVATTSYIPCISNSEITFTSVVMPASARNAFGYCFYDENKTFLSGVTFTKSGNSWGYEQKTVTVPENAKYFRTNFLSETERASSNAVFSAHIPAETKKRPYQNGYIFFSARVNQAVNQYWETDMETELADDTKMTTGVLALPKSYTPDGKPTPIIIYFHGYSHGVWFDTWGADNDFRTQKQHWLEKGFAVMDCNGGRNTNRQVHYTSGGSRQYVNGYRKCFEYVKNNYNVEENAYIVAGSAGGIAGINYAFWYSDVKAMCLLSAWTDLKTCSWGQNVKDTIVEYLGFNSSDEYEVNKTIGFDPALRIMTIGDTEYLPMLKVPTLALIGSQESNHVLYGALFRFINSARNAGNTATIRIIDGAVHKDVVSGGIQVIDNEVANWFKSN